MMGRQSEQEELFYEFRLEDHVPADHPLRKLDAVLNFDRLPHLNRTRTMPTEFAALVAIDWADQKHAGALQISGPLWKKKAGGVGGHRPPHGDGLFLIDGRGKGCHKTGHPGTTRRVAGAGAGSPRSPAAAGDSRSSEARRAIRTAAEYSGADVVGRSIGGDLQLRRPVLFLRKSSSTFS